MDKPSQDFVSDAFAHAKFIGYVPEVAPLLKAVGLDDKIDEGFVELSDKKAAEHFVAQCRELRFWERV